MALSRTSWLVGISVAGCAAALLAAACGGSAGSTSGPASCPASPPLPGSACAAAGLTCEYGGEGPYLACSTIQTCSEASTWTSNAGGGGGGTCVAVPSENDPACPSSYGALAAGAACPATNSACVYPEGKCECASCFSPDPDAGNGGNVRAWTCVKWPVADGCPTPRPRIGSACAVEGQECKYARPCGAVSTDLPNVKCEKGLWQKGVVEVLPCSVPSCSK